MNEEKINPMLSYDKKQNKPKLLNNEAILACVNYIKDGTKADVDFDVDDSFYDYMATEGYYQPSQNEVNEFIWKMVEECSEIEEEDMRPIGEIIMEKHGIKDNDNDGKDVPMGC